MKKILYVIFAVTALAIVTSSCVKDLDTKPIDPDEVTAADVFDDPASYKQILAKLYAGLAVSGQEGPSGMPDISGIDEGFGQYLRGYWYHQELTTDEAVIGWNDQTIKNFHGQNWGAADVFIAAFYYRIFYQISACNEYIRETTDSQLDERGVSGDLRTDIQYYRAEARFLRALSYWHAIDLFANPPFVTENDPVGKFFPPQKSRAEVFDYVESELLDIEDKMFSDKGEEYGRAGKAAVWMLLAKLYLNAGVYNGTDRYSDVITYTEKVINAGYDLEENFKDIFTADNDKSQEIIFPIAFDGFSTQTWGGMTFIIHAGIGGEMDPAAYGMDGGWGGTRVTSELVRKFYPDITEEGFFSIYPENGSRADYPVLYMPGSYQGWDPATADVVASVGSNESYEGYVNFPDANTTFKFTPAPDWLHGDWGDNEPADGILDKGGTDISVAEAGYYKMNVDTTTLAYTVVKTHWGLIGDATPGGWDTDTDMDFDAETGLWTVQIELTSGGKIKFRANDGWDINYGDDGVDGILEAGGADIPIDESGTYIVSMKLGAPDYTYSVVRTSFDKRAMFWTEGQTLEIEDVGNFNHGWASTKFTNITSSGSVGSNLTFPDTDFPMFRLADAYLMYAEAVLNGGGGSSATAVDYINKLRQRAYGDNGGDIDVPTMSAPSFILDERAREFYWECHRRTDLIRFGQFSDGSYVWPWKGNAAIGVAVDPKFDIFPIPDSDVNANLNLQQNPGY